MFLKLFLNKIITTGKQVKKNCFYLSIFIYVKIFIQKEIQYAIKIIQSALKNIAFISCTNLGSCYAEEQMRKTVIYLQCFLFDGLNFFYSMHLYKVTLTIGKFDEKNSIVVYITCFDCSSHLAYDKESDLVLLPVYSSSQRYIQITYNKLWPWSEHGCRYELSKKKSILLF